MIDTSSLSALRADLATAGRLVAPSWPLTSFVAVNPLGSFERLPFAEACAEGGRRLGARTHLPLAWYRDAFERGVIGEADLRAAAIAFDPILTAGERVGTAEVVDVILADLVSGPEGGVDMPAPDGWVLALRRYVGSWCAALLGGEGPLSPGEADDGFYAAWRSAAVSDPALRRLVGRDGVRLVEELSTDPAEALARSLAHLGGGEHRRLEALRTLVSRLPGWAGFARWSDDWAPADHAGPRLRMLDLIAVVAAVEAAAGPRSTFVIGLAPQDPAGSDSLDARVAAVVAALGLPADAGSAVAAVLAEVPEAARASIWLAAHEGNVRDRLLTLLDRPDPGDADERPDAQLVFCIDVRSEVLRRHLEAAGSYETFGFAGFFGVPVRWRPLGSDQAEARCPVLVTPKHEVVEAGSIAEPPSLTAGEWTRGAQHAMHDTKASLGAPFALAEALGWFSGPAAAARTFAPARKEGVLGRAWRRFADTGPTRPVVDAAEHAVSGLTLDERALFAEAIVSTIAMTRFARLVVLCGHGSKTVNNPHASSLDCGACGGAPGGPSARIAAALLNDAEVRSRLAERGIELPDDTWFLAAEHDTPSDVVTVLDQHLVPATHRADLDALLRDLSAAGEATSAERALRLPGDPGSVRTRGRDWAQVRPEWGLAGNAAFVVGPRSITKEVDLGGRVFLHSYRAEHDPDFVALETILTAPLVVAQWINSQYYFSTVDNDVLGAGDKMLHNPVGGVGVVLGDAGDLAVGLPQQSVMTGHRPAHEPVRLLAVVQAPLDAIDAIIERNAGLRDLVDNEWIGLAARPHDREPWSLRSSGGIWARWQPAAPLETDSPSLEIV